MASYPSDFISREFDTMSEVEEHIAQLDSKEPYEHNVYRVIEEIYELDQNKIDARIVEIREQKEAAEPKCQLAGFAASNKHIDILKKYYYYLGNVIRQFTLVE